MEKFKQVQLELATQIRNPEATGDGFDERRLGIYQDLFFNNVEGFCSSTFPVLKSILANDWQALIREFFIKHPCETPHFIEISQEFLEFISTSGIELPYPWCVELAHYEWAELAVTTADKQAASDNYQVSDCAMPLLYNYPVHTISSEHYADVEPKQTALVVYQDEDYEASFLEVDVLSVHLLSLMEQNAGMSREQLMALLTAEPISLSKEQAVGFLEQAISHFVGRGILLAPSE